MKEIELYCLDLGQTFKLAGMLFRVDSIYPDEQMVRCVNIGTGEYVKIDEDELVFI